jgi:hypothetical protein
VNFAKNAGVFACAVAGLASLAPAQAAYTVYTSEAAFLAATGATSATGSLSSAGTSLSSITVGSITFNAVPGSTLNFGTSANTWSTLIPGIDLAINANENFDMISGSTVYAMGFQAHEPSAGGATADTCFVGTCTDTTFQITIKNGATIIGTETINFPDNTLTFFGVHSAQAFDRFEVRDMSATIDDEFFGQVFTGATAPVPEPETYAMMLAGLGLLGFVARRRKQKAA